VKYTSAGSKLWVHEIVPTKLPGGASASGVAIDASGSAYIAGGAFGTLPGSTDPTTNADVLLAKYSGGGTQEWVHRRGVGNDDTNAVAVDTADNVFLAGSTLGDLAGPSEPNAGGEDVFLMHYTTSGTFISTHQFGSPQDDLGAGVAIDADGPVIGGTTSGTLPGSTGGHAGEDAFLAQT
jgi:hypothetical protein